MAAGEATCLEATTTGEMTENREVEVEAGDLGGRAQEIVTEVCKFFLEGRCRFGESCLNRHEGSPRLEPKEKKTSKEEQRRKKKGAKEKVEERRGGNSEKRYGTTKQIQTSGELSIYKK